MRIKKLITRSIPALGLLAVALLIGAESAAASPVLRSGEEVSVKADQIVEGDLYGAGGVVSVSGSVTGDAYLAGGSVTVNGPVSADAVIAGGSVQMHGAIGDDVRIAGGEIVIADTIEGDLVVLGGAVQILSTASIKGDVIFASGELKIEGPVEGSLYGYADAMRVDAKIGGSINARVNQALTLGDRAEVLGDITYQGNEDIVRAQGAVVVGNIQTERIEIDQNPLDLILLPLLMILFAALTIYLLFKPQLMRLIRETETSYGLNGLIGLAVLILVPLVSVVLIVSILGLFVGLALLFLYLLMLLLAWICTGPVLGVILMRKVLKTEGYTLIAVILGVVVLELLFFVPFIGPFIAFAAFAIVLGGLVRTLYTRLR